MCHGTWRLMWTRGAAARMRQLVRYGQLAIVGENKRKTPLVSCTPCERGGVRTVPRGSCVAHLIYLLSCEAPPSLPSEAQCLCSRLTTQFDFASVATCVFFLLGGSHAEILQKPGRPLPSLPVPTLP